jgi:uncharacterized protein (DUF1499 family)
LETRSRVAGAAGWSAATAVALSVLGPAAVHLGLAAPLAGFQLFQLGMLAGLVAVLLGLAGLWATRSSAGRSGRGSAAAGVLIGALAVGGPIAIASRAAGLPLINDITTDPGDPPVFVAALRIDANHGRDLSYPGDSAASEQRAAYPDLAPIRLARPPQQAFEDARGVAVALGWEITAEDSAAGTIEAYDTSRVFEFVDDVVIRVRPDGSGSVVDVRSKSRDGRGDLGVNAARIRAFRSGLAGS